jgi:hypothetical protein
VAAIQVRFLAGKKTAPFFLKGNMSKSKNTSVNFNFGGIGTVLAAALSYLKWHSFGWAFLHFFCGWFYVIYYLATYGVPHIPGAK